MAHKNKRAKVEKSKVASDYADKDDETLLSFTEWCLKNKFEFSPKVGLLPYSRAHQ
jgi:hypothetical protein